MYNLKFADYIGVWGNTDDGYEVDNSTELYNDIVLDNIDDETLIKELQERGYFKKSANMETVKIDDCFPYLEVYDTNTGYPFGCFFVEE